MGKDITFAILEEVFDERQRHKLNDPLSMASYFGIAHVLERSELIRLAAEIMICVEQIDLAKSANRAAEIRRRIEGDDDDVLRSPFPRGKAS